MKKNILAFSLVMVLALSTSAQEKIKEKNLPVTIQKAFKAQYPEAIGSTWKTKDSKYKAEFKLNDIKQTACFDESGALLSKGIEVSEADLPVAVGSAVKSAYTDRAIEAVYKVDKAGVTGYLITFAGDPIIKQFYAVDGSLMNDKDQEWWL